MIILTASLFWQHAKLELYCFQQACLTLTIKILTKHFYQKYKNSSGQSIIIRIFSEIYFPITCNIHK
jgi:hypothetical protein